jgi:hypothetical protein
VGSTNHAPAPATLIATCATATDGKGGTESGSTTRSCVALRALPCLVLPRALNWWPWLTVADLASFASASRTLIKAHAPSPSPAPAPSPTAAQRNFTTPPSSFVPSIIPRPSIVPRPSSLVSPAQSRTPLVARQATDPTLLALSIIHPRQPITGPQGQRLNQFSHFPILPLTFSRTGSWCARPSQELSPSPSPVSLPSPSTRYVEGTSPLSGRTDDSTTPLAFLLH